ncbi:MAG: hypothetical protein LBC99_04180, partial [Spirochaetota bacterium]|nr:hypothetical protein [Spirochaetota bacterium]
MFGHFVGVQRYSRYSHSHARFERSTARVKCGVRFEYTSARIQCAAQFGAAPDFVGLRNATGALTDPVVWGVIARSLAFCLVNAASTVILGVLLALLMNAVAKWARLVLQLCLLLARAMPVVAVMTVWNWLFDWNHGTINWLAVQTGAQGIR